MIQTRDQSEVVTLGDVQKYKVGIDEKNLNHIVTILSSNLYSYPMTSFLRETVSNAWDSHVEAGVDEPIIITKSRDNLAIRDFGTGISPERFKEIYLNIGSSTKRESNQYIGAFGLGRFSCLSVSDLANITSFYNGKAYYYVMNKDVDQLHIDLLLEKKTDEKNGVEVKVPLRSLDADNLECLSFIENVYVEDETGEMGGRVQYFNKRKIHSCKNFKFCTIVGSVNYSKPRILLGKIPYVVDYWQLWEYGDKKYQNWEDTFKRILPTIEIGSVDITPNREGLLYSERTKEVLRKAYNACIDELMEIWNTQTGKEYEDIIEYIYRMSRYASNYAIIDGGEILLDSSLVENTHFKGHKNWDDISPKRKKEIVYNVLGYELTLFGKLCGGTLYQGKREQRWFTLKKLLNKWVKYDNRTIIALPYKSGFSSQYFKDFVEEKYGDNDIIFIKQLPSVSIATVRNFIRSTFGTLIFSNKEEVLYIVELVKEIIDSLSKSVITTNIMADPDYEAFKKAHMLPKTKKAVPTKEICFTYYPTEWSGFEKETCTIDKIISFLKGRVSRKCHIVYADMDSPFISVLRELQYPNLVILAAAKGNMKYLKENLPSWVKPVEDLYSPDNRVLQKYAAIRHINELIYKAKIAGIKYSGLPYIPFSVRKKLRALEDFYNKYGYTKSSYGSVDVNPIIDIVPPEKYDRQILALFNQTRHYLEICRLPGLNQYRHLEMYLLMKAKKIRLDYEYYKQATKVVKNILSAI